MHKVKKATYLKNYELQIIFEDNSVRVFDVSPYIKDGLSFIPLQDKDIFKMFEVKGNTVAWITGADISPDFIYENSNIIKEKINTTL